MYEKEFPRIVVDTMDDNPCKLVDGNYFIWTSTTCLFIRTRWRNGGHRKRTIDVNMKEQVQGSNDKKETEIIVKKRARE